jgi:hypothetical protein
LVAAIGEYQFNEWQNGTTMKFVKSNQSVFVAQRIIVHAVQVAERRRKLASHIVAGFIAANHLRPEKTLETPMNYPLSLQDNSHFRSRTRHDAPG